MCTLKNPVRKADGQQILFSISYLGSNYSSIFQKYKSGNTTTATKKGAQVLWQPEICLAVSANTSFYHQEQQE